MNDAMKEFAAAWAASMDRIAFEGYDRAAYTGPDITFNQYYYPDGDSESLWKSDFTLIETGDQGWANLALGGEVLNCFMDERPNRSARWRKLPRSHLQVIERPLLEIRRASDATVD